MIEYAIEAAKRWKPVVVAGVEVRAYLAGRADVTLVSNDEPALGMSHSLALANRAIPDDEPIVVLLGDKPLVSAALVETICEASRDADFGYPERDGVPGHPVVLSRRARAMIDALPSGDTLRLLRTDPQLTTRAVETTDPGAFFDVDRG
jgi:molybdenum cofactor cytidylyltransferase